MLLYESRIKTLPRIGRGKVRDIYAVGSDKMLIVTSDRLSAFDVVLSDPIFTPATKAAAGHDENISFAEAEKLIGKALAAKVRDTSIRLYKEAADYAVKKGIIIADTKFEFGLTPSNALVLIDEVLTADSSRFWPADSYRVGMSPPSFDKQYVRDYLETLDWNKAPPAPRLPAEVIARTSEKYREALTRLTGKKLS